MITHSNRSTVLPNPQSAGLGGQVGSSVDRSVTADKLEGPLSAIAQRVRARIPGAEISPTAYGFCIEGAGAAGFPTLLEQVDGQLVAFFNSNCFEFNCAKYAERCVVAAASGDIFIKESLVGTRVDRWWAEARRPTVPDEDLTYLTGGMPGMAFWRRPTRRVLFNDR